MTPARVLATFVVVLAAAGGTGAAYDNPFTKHGRLRVAKSGTHLEHADGTPFFFLADTCWTGPALSTAEDWDFYLKDRKAKGFTAIQFNCVCPWRAAPTDAAKKFGPHKFGHRKPEPIPRQRIACRIVPTPQAIMVSATTAVTSAKLPPISVTSTISYSG